MTLAMTASCVSCTTGSKRFGEHARTVQRYDAEDEDDGERHDHHGVDFQAGRLIRVEPCKIQSAAVM